MQPLDVLIAFAVVTLGVSLLITILTQMISALAGYRGTNSPPIRPSKLS